ncbi:hypothetical protein Tco_0150534 [Tanacetum coccineum]
MIGTRLPRTDCYTIPLTVITPVPTFTQSEVPARPPEQYLVLTCTVPRTSYLPPAQSDTQSLEAHVSPPEWCHVAFLLFPTVAGQPPVNRLQTTGQRWSMVVNDGSQRWSTPSDHRPMAAVNDGQRWRTTVDHRQTTDQPPEGTFDVHLKKFEIMMIDELSIVKIDKVNHTMEMDMLKLVVEVECFGKCVDEFDKVTVLFGEMQLKQEDRSYVHASSELHLHVDSLESIYT